MNVRTATLVTPLFLLACAEQPTALAPLAGAESPALSLHGGGIPSSVAFTSMRDGNADIFLMHASGTDQTAEVPARNLTGSNTGADHWPAMASNGRIAFASVRQPHTHFEIYTMAPDGSDVTRVTSSLSANIQPAWSPNGQGLAFVRGSLGSRQIWVLDLRHGGERQLTAEGDNYRPNWSPDGRRIVFASDRDGDFENALAREKSANFGLHDLYMMDSVDGGNLVRLTHQRTTLDGEPAFSPHGRQIAFRTRRFTNDAGDNYCAIAVMNADGSDLRNLTPIPGGMAWGQWCNAYPAWSRDGRQIYFHAQRSTELGLQIEIYAIGVDGATERRLTWNSASDAAPAVR
jgi:TolB protein